MINNNNNNNNSNTYNNTYNNILIKIINIGEVRYMERWYTLVTTLHHALLAHLSLSTWYLEIICATACQSELKVFTIDIYLNFQTTVSCTEECCMLRIHVIEIF